PTFSAPRLILFDDRPGRDTITLWRHSLDAAAISTAGDRYRITPPDATYHPRRADRLWPHAAASAGPCGRTGARVGAERSGNTVRLRRDGDRRLDDHHRPMGNRVDRRRPGGEKGARPARNQELVQRHHRPPGALH